MKHFSIKKTIKTTGIFLSLTGMIFMLSNCNQKTLSLEDGDAFVNEVIEEVDGVTAQEAKEIMDTASFYLVIDVREPNEHHPGYIPGSVNIPRGILEFNVNKEAFWESKSLYPPYKTDLVFVYCKKGKRSILASATLQQMGYSNIQYIEGGFKAWELAFPNDYERDEVDTGHAEEAEEVGGC